MNNIISIITPSLNQGQFIEQTIKSVLFQAGNFYIDYIIVDGGSIDNSIDIIKKYDLLIKNNKYSIKCYGIKFRWFSKKDKGQTNALNKGFKMANGDICAWINSDDWYEKDVFQFIIKKFEENLEIDLIYGNCFDLQPPLMKFSYKPSHEEIRKIVECYERMSEEERVELGLKELSPILQLVFKLPPYAEKFKNIPRWKIWERRKLKKRNRINRSRVHGSVD